MVPVNRAIGGNGEKEFDQGHTATAREAAGLAGNATGAAVSGRAVRSGRMPKNCSASAVLLRSR